jgi:hypothetical protein
MLTANQSRAKLNKAPLRDLVTGGRVTIREIAEVGLLGVPSSHPFSRRRRNMILE